MTHRRRRLVPLAGLLTWTAACASDDSAVCVRSDVGEVCAENSSDMISFSGTGLAAGSKVVIDEPEIGPVVDDVDGDGEFESAAA